MSLPPNIKQRISSQFEELLSTANGIMAEMRQSEREQRARDRASYASYGQEYQHRTQEFFSLKTRILTLIEHLTFRNGNLQHTANEISSLTNTISDLEKLIGYLDGLKRDFDSGMFEDLTSLVVADVSADYMSQAEQLLGEGISGQFDHVPAAVLSAAVLEGALRRLCERQDPPIPLNKTNGDPKTLGTCIDDLKKAGLYNELKAKQLRAWADIRNAAAHGDFAKFDRQDVETMIKGIKNFLADYL
jgi:hypothetical protein